MFNSSEISVILALILALNRPKSSLSLWITQTKNLLRKSLYLSIFLPEFFLVLLKMPDFWLISTKKNYAKPIKVRGRPILRSTERPRCVFLLFYSVLKKKNSQGKNIRKRSEKLEKKFNQWEKQGSMVLTAKEWRARFRDNCIGKICWKFLVYKTK